MWSSMSFTISLVLAICWNEPQVSCVWAVWAWGRPWAGQSRVSTYLYPAHTSLPMNPCGETWPLLTCLGLGECVPLVFFYQGLGTQH